MASFHTLDVIVATDYLKRIPIVVSGYAGSSALTNFPILVKLAAGQPFGFDYADCVADGSDIRFAASDGTMLSHEIESWDTNDTSYVWVKVPVLSGKTTALSLYYGADPNALPAVNPADVWTRYAAVFHGGSTIADSTGKSAAVRANTVAGSASGGKVGGVMSKAQQSVTGVQFSNPVKSGAMSSATKASVSGWYKRSNSGNTVITAANVGAWGGGGFLALVEGGSYFSVAVSSTHQGTGGQGALVKDVWGHLAFACDGSNVSSYFNGSGIYSGSKGKTMSDPGETYWAIGSYSAAGTNGFIGDMDEVRFFNGVASADWFKAEYDSVADPASFVSLSPAESVDMDLPRFGALSATDENGVATFSVALDRPAFGGAAPTSVSVFYGTDGENWTELPLGATNEVGTLTGTASGLTGNARYLWYASASATQDASTKEATSSQRSFVTRALDPAGTYKSFTATVDWDGEPVENVPVLLRISETAITGFDYSAVTESGFEIIDGSGHLLPYEIDTWNTDGESLIWVLLPVYEDGATLTVRYGVAFANTPLPSESVWAGYKGVWHMNTTSPADASLSGNNGTPVGSPAVVAGAISSALSLPTSSDYVTCGTALANSELASGFTVEGWANPSATSGKCPMFGKGGLISVRIDGGKIVVTTPNVLNHDPISAPISVGKWFHWALTFVPGSNGLKFYADGTLVGTMMASSISDTTGFTQIWLGRNQWNEAYTGLLDEMRLSAGIRTASEIAAEYHAMADGGALTYTTVESSDTDIPVIGAVSVVDSNGSATFSVELERPACGGAVPTSVSVFYGTDGENWTEFSLGSTNEVATLAATASGFEAGVRYIWYAEATATSGGTPKTATSAQRSFVAKAFDPTGYYKSFTATVVYDGSPAENVPFPIRISEAGIQGFDYDDVTASGFEILDAGGQLLPYEIDTWDTNGESILWTRLPVYENGATVTIRYGAPFANAPIPATDVWTGYAGVWHLGEASGDAQDSTGNGLVAVAYGANKEEDSVGVACKIGKGRQMATAQGRKSYLSVADNNLLDCGDSLTFSGWFKASGTYDNYSMRYVSRKNAYNSQNGWEAEALYGGAVDSAKTVSARGASDGDHKTTVPDVRNDWLHLVLVYNGKTLSSYVNGVPQTPLTLKAACSDNDLALSFGNNAVGNESNWCGWMDELRFLSDPVSAEYAVAEYHAMADAGAISFSSVSSSDMSAPVLGIPSVASNPDGSFTVSVEVSENTPASIVCMVGGTELAMTTSDASLPATYTATFSQLQLAAGTHVATVRATATSGTVVSSICPTAFHVGSLTIVKQSDADEGTLTPGVFRVSRLDADSTGLPAVTFDVAFSGSGVAAIADPGISTATIPAGAAYVDIAVTPVPTDEVDEDSELVLTVSGAQIGQQSTGTLTVVDAGFDLAVRYVATDGNDANSGGTPEKAKKTIAAAVAAVNPVAPSRPCTVHVATGLYPITKPIVVTNAISVVADDPDPSRTVVSNTVIGGWGAMNRIFTINHAGAFVANLTMQNGNVNGSDHGGNFNVGSAGGIVSNCVVEAGKSNGNLYGAGARLSGGLVTHTVFRKNNCGSGMGNWQGQHGGVLELYGSSRAENCLFVDNPPSGTVYLSLIGDSAVMRNCTIADTGLSKTNEYCTVFTAIRITSANATVLNTVIAGVTNTIDGAACPPTGSGVAKFQNGAFDGDVTGLPEGTVTGTAAEFFKDYANGDYTPKTGGPLVGKGANYEGMASVDLAGNPRVVGSKVDIGCYEATSTPLMIIVR